MWLVILDIILIVISFNNEPALQMAKIFRSPESYSRVWNGQTMGTVDEISCFDGSCMNVAPDYQKHFQIIRASLLYCTAGGVSWIIKYFGPPIQTEQAAFVFCFHIFLHQELILYRCSSCCCWGDRLQKSLGYTVRRLRRFQYNRDEIWQDCLLLNYILIGWRSLIYCYDVILSRCRPWRHLTLKSAATRWVNTKRQPDACACAAASVGSRFIVAYIQSYTCYFDKCPAKRTVGYRVMICR